MEASPATVATTIGKKQISTTMTIFGCGPKPSQTTSSGATATFGTALRRDEEREGGPLDRPRRGQHHGDGQAGGPAITKPSSVSDSVGQVSRIR